MSKTINPTMDKAAIVKAIASIANRGKILDNDIQATALSIIAHVEKHGEVSLANQLFDAMPRGSRKNALVEWFISYGKIAVNTDKATAKKFPLVFRKDGKTNIEAGTKMPWFEMRKEAQPSEVFDFDKQFSRMLQQLQNAVDNGLEIKGDTEKLNKFAALAGIKLEQPEQAQEAEQEEV